MNSKNNICEISNIHYEIINNILTDDNSKALCLEQVKKEEPHQSNNTELLRFSRHISLDIYFNNNEDKSDNVDNILKELSSISSANTYQEDDTILILQLSGIVDKMLSNLSQADKSIYLYRYFYAYSLEDIASLCKTTASNAEKVISQCNNKLKDLIEETKLITDNKSLLLSFTDIDNSHLLSLTASSTSKKEIVKPDSPTRKSRKISIPVLLNIILSITLVLSIGIIVIQYKNFSRFMKEHGNFSDSGDATDIDEFYININGQHMVDGDKLYELGSYSDIITTTTELTLNSYIGSYDPMVLPEYVPLYDFIGEEITEFQTNHTKYYKLKGCKSSQYIISEYKNEYQFLALSYTKFSNNFSATDITPNVSFGELLSGFYGLDKSSDIEEFVVMPEAQDSGYADCHTTKHITYSSDIQYLFDVLYTSTYKGNNLETYMEEHNLSYSYVYSNSVFLFIHGKNKNAVDYVLYYPNENIFIDFSTFSIYEPANDFDPEYLRELLRFYSNKEEAQDPKLWNYSLTCYGDTSSPYLELTIKASPTTNTHGKYIGSDFTIDILEDGKWVPLTTKNTEDKIHIPFYERLNADGTDTQCLLSISPKYYVLEPGEYRLTVTIYDSNSTDLDNPAHKDFSTQFIVR